MDAGYSVSTIYEDSVPALGAVAQLGERMTGSHEVRGSIPLGSTNTINSLGPLTAVALSVCADSIPTLKRCTFTVQRRILVTRIVLVLAGVVSNIIDSRVLVRPRSPQRDERAMNVGGNMWPRLVIDDTHNPAMRFSAASSCGRLFSGRSR